MKKGMDLMELDREIIRRSNAKHDYLAPTQKLRLTSEGRLVVGDLEPLNVNSVCHEQLAEHVKIPKEYYDRMLTEAPDLLVTNVERWFTKYPAKRMIRTLDGTARAFLSDKFNTEMDNDDFAKAVVPVLKELKLDIMSAQITDRRLYIKAVDPKVSRELAKHGAKFGDGGHTIVTCLSPAVTISNSEVGHGSLSVQGGVYDRFCSNLGSFGERSVRKSHVGGRHTMEDRDLYVTLTDRTKKLDAAALWSRIQDVVRATFERAKFDALCDKIEGTRADVIDPIEAVEVVKKVCKHSSIGLSEAETKATLGHFVDRGEFTRCGVFSAITRMSQDDIVTYDRATELERIGAKVVELERNEWRKLAHAA